MNPARPQLCICVVLFCFAVFCFSLTTAYLIHRELVDRETKKASQLHQGIDKKTPYTHLVYARLCDTRQLEADATIHDYSGFMEKHPSAVDESFLANLRVCDPATAGKGITWYELYILYRISGFTKPVKDNTSKAQPPLPWQQIICKRSKGKSKTKRRGVALSKLLRGYPVVLA